MVVGVHSTLTATACLFLGAGLAHVPAADDANLRIRGQAL